MKRLIDCCYLTVFYAFMGHWQKGTFGDAGKTSKELTESDLLRFWSVMFY